MSPTYCRLRAALAAAERERDSLRGERDALEEYRLRGNEHLIAERDEAQRTQRHIKEIAAAVWDARKALVARVRVLERALRRIQFVASTSGKWEEVIDLSARALRGGAGASIDASEQAEDGE